MDETVQFQTQLWRSAAMGWVPVYYNPHTPAGYVSYDYWYGNEEAAHTDADDLHRHVQKTDQNAKVRLVRRTTIEETVVEL